MQEIVKKLVEKLITDTISEIKSEYYVGTVKEFTREYYGAVKMLEKVGLINEEEKVELVMNFTIKYTLPFLENYNHLLFQIEKSGNKKDKQIHVWGYDSKDKDGKPRFNEFYFFQELCKNIHMDIRTFVNENEQKYKNVYQKFKSDKSIKDFLLKYNNATKSSTIITLNIERDNLLIQSLPYGFYILQWKEE